jgi:hypothetical protein
MPIRVGIMCKMWRKVHSPLRVVGDRGGSIGVDSDGHGFALEVQGTQIAGRFGAAVRHAGPLEVFLTDLLSRMTLQKRTGRRHFTLRLQILFEKSRLVPEGRSVGQLVDHVVNLFGA